MSDNFVNKHAENVKEFSFRNKIRSNKEILKMSHACYVKPHNKQIHREIETQCSLIKMGY